MTIDLINEEILRIKRELASKFDNDLARIVADTRSRERDAVSMPRRPWEPEQNNAPEPQVFSNGAPTPTTNGDC